MINEQATPTSAAALPSHAKVKTLACLGGVSLERGVSVDEIHGYVRDPANVVWVDIQDPGPQEYSMLLEEFGFHPLALEDVGKGLQRPKVTEYKGYLFAVTYSVARRPDSDDFTATEVGLFIGKNYLVSLHWGRSVALEEAMSRWSRGGKMLTEGAGYLVYTVMDAIIDTFFPVINGIEDELENSEMEVFSRSGFFGVERMLKHKRILFELRRILSPLRDAFHVFLRRDHPVFSANTLIYFQSVYDHILRLLDAIDMEREMVAGALQAHLAVTSNRLNAVMKALTMVTVVVAIAGSVFGAWGMNFSRIPLADSPWGFWIIWGGIVLLVVSAMLFSWIRGWL
jgi:magnesium transporter